MSDLITYKFVLFEFFCCRAQWHDVNVKPTFSPI